MSTPETVPPYLFSQAGTFPAPFTFTVPASLEVQPYTAHATFDATSAAGAFRPCLTFYSSSGVVLGRYFPAELVQPGDVAEVTYTPPFGSASTSGGGGGSGFQFNSGTYGPDNVGDWSLIEATGAATQVFSQPAAADPDGWGLAINTVDGILLTCDPASGFVLAVTADITTAPGAGCLGVFIDAENTSAGGTGDVTALGGVAAGDGTGNVYGINMQPSGGANNQGNVTGVAMQVSSAFNAGGGPAISTVEALNVSASANGVSTAATGAVIGASGNNNNQFVTGATITADTALGGGGTGEVDAVQALATGNSDSTTVAVRASAHNPSTSTGGSDFTGVLASATAANTQPTGTLIGVDAYATPSLGHTSSTNAIGVRANAPSFNPGGASIILQCNQGVGGSPGVMMFEVRADGNVIAPNLPTSAAGLPTGAIWNNSGVLNIV